MVVHFQKGQAVTTLSTELSCGCALSEWLGCDNFRQLSTIVAATNTGCDQLLLVQEPHFEVGLVPLLE